LVVLPPSVERLIDLALEEDLGRGDVTSEAIFGRDATKRRGVILAKEPLVVAGLDVAEATFRRLGAELTRLVEDGVAIGAAGVVAEVTGNLLALLSAERTALNFLQRLSGIATLTRRYVEATLGTAARICDTRKTAPGFRFLDKRAVAAGGGANHRFDLASGILIKDNHVAAAGNVSEAVMRAKGRAPHPLRIEVEVTTLSQVTEALDARAELILLDNMSLDEVRAAVELIAGRALVEVSGGVTFEKVRALAETGVDLISVGALTHSARAVDLSFEILAGERTVPRAN
jgi:nicotinate-nucleotide pyrophosphorylase (carboxylating)